MMKTLQTLLAALRPHPADRARYARQTVKLARQHRARTRAATARTPRAAERAWRDQFTA